MNEEENQNKNKKKNKNKRQNKTTQKNPNNHKTPPFLSYLAGQVIAVGHWLESGKTAF